MYTLDYIRDTEDLNLEENGAYLLLLFSYWNRQEPLPNDDKKLSKILRVSEREWKKVKPSVMRFFRIEGEVIVNDRMNYEINRANEKSQKAKESAMHRWPKTDDEETSERNANASETHMPTECSSPSPLPLSLQKDRKSRPAFEKNSPPVLMAELIYSEHLRWQPNFLGGKDREKAFQSWATDIDKLNRIDGYDFPTIEKIIRYAQSDSFWQSNILSGYKLRERFDMLFSKSQNPSKPKREEPSAGKYDPSRPKAEVRKI
jgi:uncharacterized protein YdaU (DUF1376 family)